MSIAESLKVGARSVIPTPIWKFVQTMRRLPVQSVRASSQPTRHDLFEIQRVEANHKLFDLGMAYLWSAGDTAFGDYYEFGICGAGQFREAMAMAHKWGLDRMHFRAFDSFQGLPGTGHLAMSEQAFRASIEATGLDCSRVTTYAGFYANSLTDELQAELKATKRPAMFVNVDRDLHDSRTSFASSRR
jgi:hypothetical protein